MFHHSHFDLREKSPHSTHKDFSHSFDMTDRTSYPVISTAGRNLHTQRTEISHIRSK